MNLKSIACAIVAVIAPLALASNPAVVYTEAPKFDSSFNEAMYRQGVVPFKAEYGRNLVEANPSSPDEFVGQLTNLAKQGRSPIIALGFSFASALQEVAPQFPDTQFAIIDSVVDLPNVQSIVFKEHEGSFVVGALAALKAKGDKIGFIGGVDLPFIRRFGCGYAQGAAYINDDIQVYLSMASTDFSGFSIPEKGNELASKMITQGVEVIYAAAGGTGNGVYEAAANHSNVYAIGVDSNQNFLHTGTMLTSMVKNVGIAAYNVLEDAEKGIWNPGVTELGLAENGVDWVLDIFNRGLVSKSDEKKINKIRDAIKSGKIKVVDYNATNQCPVPFIEG
ncbi:BMP family ABC transporter substrate-binding protein [Reinekea marina]|uniref:BMP family protein n=1 Tax=Reinekea marina TaxID=1310421 RepID=A0ABV7WT21_9GAMM|nr:BMP family ABC transporter substrate-binding protein [Reinekea marina]MDN3647557.1 BMP family ABC transporter substrate-binding protein [Reinekea marina]MDN3651123.1 BMP family ABC transporter substrate-binding protein [Reinekea marina]